MAVRIKQVEGFLDLVLLRFRELLLVSLGFRLLLGGSRGCPASWRLLDRVHIVSCLFGVLCICHGCDGYLPF